VSDVDRAAQLEYILDHYQNPRNYGPLADADVHLEGGHPGCSDVVTIYLQIRDGAIQAISFEGQGCTISQAAASMLTEHVQGMPVAQATKMDYQFLIEELGEELVKTRPRCATLGLDTLKATLEEYRRKQIRGEI
jgi:nitrogen fixation protein NifU and related proteins